MAILVTARATAAGRSVISSSGSEPTSACCRRRRSRSSDTRKRADIALGRGRACCIYHITDESPLKCQGEKRNKSRFRRRLGGGTGYFNAYAWMHFFQTRAYGRDTVPPPA